MENLLAALTYVLQPYHIGVVFFGTLIGILVGAMPGLSSIMGLSIMMPLTLSLDGNAGMLMLLVALAFTFFYFKVLNKEEE